MGNWRNTIDRLLSRYVDKTSDCWVWTGRTAHGYGYASFEGRYRRVHRLMYEVFKGPIEGGVVLDHLCRNRACVNPDHLEAVSERENILRGISISAENAKKTHCQNGHPLSGSNLYWVESANERQCKTCRREYKREWRARRRAQGLASV